MIKQKQKTVQQTNRPALLPAQVDTVALQQEAAVRQEALQCVVSVLEGMLAWYKAATGQGDAPASDSAAYAEEVIGHMAGVVRWVPAGMACKRATCCCCCCFCWWWPVAGPKRGVSL